MGVLIDFVDYATADVLDALKCHDGQPAWLPDPGDFVHIDGKDYKVINLVFEYGVQGKPPLNILSGTYIKVRLELVT